MPVPNWMSPVSAVTERFGAMILFGTPPAIKPHPWVVCLKSVSVLPLPLSAWTNVLTVIEPVLLNRVTPLLAPKLSKAAPIAIGRVRAACPALKALGRTFEIRSARMLVGSKMPPRTIEPAAAR